jgi:hypothetical protein
VFWEKSALFSPLLVLQRVLAIFFLYGGLVKLVLLDVLPEAALVA